MQLTIHTDYSLRLLIYLAVNPMPASAPVKISDVAQAYKISIHHLAKVAQTMIQLGYIKGQRGRGGGLILLKQAEEINIGTLLRQTENMHVLDCLGPQSDCPITPVCHLKKVIAEATEAFASVLDAYTLSDIVSNAKQLRSTLALDDAVVKLHGSIKSIE